MIIDHIQNYLSKDKLELFTEIVNEIYLMTKHLNQTYPGYKQWFFDKQVKGCYTLDRDIIFIKNDSGKIIGISCVKKDDEEKNMHYIC